MSIRSLRCACIDGHTSDCSRWAHPVWPMCPRSYRDNEPRGTANDRQTIPEGIQQPWRNILGQDMRFGSLSPGGVGCSSGRRSV